jgi:uncharacterized protein DUF3224
MMLHAAGDFEVTVTPLPADDPVAGTSIGRLALLKTFHGDLEATSKGVMLGAGNRAAGRAGYVAIEEVTGTLEGRSGSFALQHCGAMSEGSIDLVIRVVPGSGTGDLAGLGGTMTILIEGGRHGYTFEYTLPEPSC